MTVQPPTEPDSPIESYLDELVVGLSTRRPRQLRRLVAEAEAHLRDDAANGVASGMSVHAAERAAVDRFGPARAITTAEQQPTAPLGTVVRQFGLTGLLLGSIGALAVGVSGLIAAGIDLLAGARVLAAPAPGTALSAADCARWFSLHPGALGCRAAATADWAYEVVVYRVALGLLGAVGLGVFVIARRRWLRPDRWPLLPAAVRDTIALTLFGAAGIWLLGMGVDAVAVASADGAGQWLSGALVALAAAAAFGVRLIRDLNSDPTRASDF